MNIRNRKGQALVELAFSLPLLLAIVFGIAEIGRAMYMKNTLNYAAREGARRAAVSSAFSKSQIESDVKGCLPFDTTRVQIDLGAYNSSVPAAGSGVPITVTVTVPFENIFTEMIPQLNGLTLAGQATMRYEI